MSSMTGFAVLAALVALGVAWRVVLNDRRRSAARVAALTDAIDGLDAAAPLPGPDGDRVYFSEAGVKSRPGLVTMAGAATIVMGIVVGAAMTLGQSRVTTQASQATAAETPALELLSMRHEQNDDHLTVTGFVRNAGETRATQVIAVVFAFDAEGGFLASGRAPLEFTTLAAGDESPFRVSLANVGGASRYRVSFRTEQGLLPHVDRRQRAVVAQARVQ